MRSTSVLAGKLKGADLVLNADGGGGELDGAGKAVSYGIQGAEKTYADFTFTVTDPGGHSSRPTPGNPIYRLARALERVENHRFPVQSNEITRASLAASGRDQQGPVGEALRRFSADPTDAAAAETLSSDPAWAPYLRTTCVATMVSGGHATNALPPPARCRQGRDPGSARRASGIAHCTRPVDGSDGQHVLPGCRRSELRGLGALHPRR